ncbi:phosphoribosyl 1,2-cyclic phosphate phosphodiesterase [Streptococcus rupicaprae]|uniref:Phosphoribosyl 1,2-cyclic phosphate phosphodiesterase n=1 Tax=Streptococcus rupicaprae TaxID=759619 RepID=A0ABV2FGJ2_9STRE
MKFRFIGTGASEGYPATFCGCEGCRKAKQLGGKNLRRRASAVIDDHILLDFGPDLYTANFTDLVDLPSVTDIVFTHSHVDHLYEKELFNLFEPMGVENPNLPIRIYGNETVISQIRDYMTIFRKRSLEKIAEVMTLITIQPFESFQVGNLTFTALLANHAGPNEDAYIYEIVSDGKSMLYGTDTGLLPEETKDYLTDHPLDVYIFDATSGKVPCPYKEHMGYPEIAQTLEEIRVVGRDGVRIYGTHFVHSWYEMHDDLIKSGAPYGIIPAYDGMSFEL